MTQYIDKAAVVAEIRKYINNAEAYLKYHHNCNDKLVHSFEQEKSAMCELLSFLDTLEVKEVDLEKEIDKWWCSLFTDYSMNRVPNHKFIPAPAYIDSNFKQSETGKTKIAFELWMDWKVDSNDIEWDSETIREFARHFFELGLKAAQKGE